jgi:hypothetical protein
MKVRKLSLPEAERLDRAEWRAMSSPEKFSALWDLSVAWMDMHGIPEEQRRLQKTIIVKRRLRDL